MRGEHEVLSRRAEVLQAELAALRASREAAEAERDRLWSQAETLRGKVEEARALPVRSYRGLGIALAIAAVLVGGVIAWLASVEERVSPAELTPEGSTPSVRSRSILPDSGRVPRRCLHQVDCAPFDVCNSGLCTPPDETRRPVVPGR